MKRCLFPILIMLLLLGQACTSTRRFGTTIERDENNVCQVNLVIQVGIQGTDADVETVRTALEACFGTGCFIPCPEDSAKGCMSKATVSVKKWSSLNEDEQHGYHYVQMIDDDGLPSTAYTGRPNINTADESCLWRRGQPAGTYCHEVLHLCGLPDRYCSRIYDPVLDSVITEITCDPPPDPGVNCCVPGTGQRRCSTPCAGHEGDIMGSSWAGLSCDNIKDVLTRAGFGNCPPECCSSNKTFTRPPDETYIIPGYLHFGNKDNSFGGIGVGIGYDKKISTHFGVTIDAGIHTKTEKTEDTKQTDQLLHIGAGVSYTPGQAPSSNGISFTTHLLAGIMAYKQKIVVAGEGIGETQQSFCLIAGASLNWRLNPRLSVRLLQADYMPTFFGEETQHNWRVGAGLVLRLSGK